MPTCLGVGIAVPFDEKEAVMTLKRYVIERDLPGIGGSSDAELAGARATSNSALAGLALRVPWEHSYVAGDKTFCLYLAEDEEAIREHSRISGYPATTITEVKAIIDPTTGS